MSRHRPLRGVKFCAHCGSGYDAFKAMELRGRFCSPACLTDAREARRGSSPAGDPLLVAPPAATLIS